jgi:REP element-mobilizing transposase RayT
VENEKFVEYMQLYEKFCGVEVITFCCMSNHFHILLGVPKAPQGGLSEEELLGRMQGIYSQRGIEDFKQRLEAAKQVGPEEVEPLKATVTYRMHDLSEFMKALKQRFTQWYNTTHQRKGTLWEERFKSVFMEGSEHVLATMAAYIDLNPVRARIVEDPKDYRWSGYGQAVAGVKEAMEGLREVAVPQQHREISDAEVLANYRKKLYFQGVEQNRGSEGYQVGFEKEKLVEVINAKGKLSEFEFLRCRVRYI